LSSLKLVPVYMIKIRVPSVNSQHLFEHFSIRLGVVKKVYSRKTSHNVNISRHLTINNGNDTLQAQGRKVF